MTHEELEAVRRRAAVAACYYLARDPGHAEKFRRDPRSYPVAASAIDVPALLAYIDELHGIVHDLRQEPGWELGRQEERREVLALLTDHRGYHDEESNSEAANALADVHFDVARRGPVAPHIAPDDLRRENETLRAALAALIRAADRDTDIRWASHSFHTVLDDARRLLGEV